MFSCSLKNGTTMEYWIGESLAILFSKVPFSSFPGLRSHSLSGESPAMRQDFYSRQPVLASRSFRASANVSPSADSEELFTNLMAQGLEDSGDSQTRTARVIRVD